MMHHADPSDLPLVLLLAFTSSSTSKGQFFEAKWHVQWSTRSLKAFTHHTHKSIFIYIPLVCTRAHVLAQSILFYLISFTLILMHTNYPFSFFKPLLMVLSQLKRKETQSFHRRMLFAAIDSIIYDKPFTYVLIPPLIIACSS